MSPSSRPHRRPIAAAALGIAVTLLAAACGRASSTGTGASAASAVAGSPAASGAIVVAATYPQSGPLALVGAAGRGAEAYIKKVNASGGVNGRQITWISYDDAYDPARMTANARRAVEQDHANVVLSFGGPSLAIRPYLNQQKVFQLVLAGNTPFSDTTKYPYTRAWYPDIKWEAELTARHIKQTSPKAKVGILGFNNDLTDSAAGGFTAAGLTPALVLKVPPTQSDVTAQVTQLKAAGVDNLYMTVSAGQAIGAVKYLRATGYSPNVFLYSTTAGRKGVINVLGAAAKGLYTNLWLADPGDGLWTAQSGIADFQATVKQYGQASDVDDLLAIEGYAAAGALVAALKATSGSLTADGIASGWSSLKNVAVAGLPPGTTLNAGPGGRLVYSFQLVQFDGSNWKAVGDVKNAMDDGVAA